MSFNKKVISFSRPLIISVHPMYIEYKQINSIQGLTLEVAAENLTKIEELAKKLKVEDEDIWIQLSKVVFAIGLKFFRLSLKCIDVLDLHPDQFSSNYISTFKNKLIERGRRLREYNYDVNELNKHDTTSFEKVDETLRTIQDITVKTYLRVNNNYNPFDAFFDEMEGSCHPPSDNKHLKQAPPTESFEPSYLAPILPEKDQTLVVHDNSKKRRDLISNLKAFQSNINSDPSHSFANIDEIADMLLKEGNNEFIEYAIQFNDVKDDVKQSFFSLLLLVKYNEIDGDDVVDHLNRPVRSNHEQLDRQMKDKISKITAIKLDSFYEGKNSGTITDTSKYPLTFIYMFEHYKRQNNSIWSCFVPLFNFERLENFIEKSIFEFENKRVEFENVLDQTSSLYKQNQDYLDSKAFCLELIVHFQQSKLPDFQTELFFTMTLGNILGYLQSNKSITQVKKRGILKFILAELPNVFKKLPKSHINYESPDISQRRKIELCLDILHIMSQKGFLKSRLKKNMLNHNYGNNFDKKGLFEFLSKLIFIHSYSKNIGNGFDSFKTNELIFNILSKDTLTHEEYDRDDAACSYLLKDAPICINFLVEIVSDEKSQIYDVKLALSSLKLLVKSPGFFDLPEANSFMTLCSNINSGILNRFLKDDDGFETLVASMTEIPNQKVSTSETPLPIIMAHFSEDIIAEKLDAMIVQINSCKTSSMSLFKANTHIQIKQILENGTYIGNTNLVCDALDILRFIWKEADSRQELLGADTPENYLIIFLKACSISNNYRIAVNALKFIIEICKCDQFQDRFLKKDFIESLCSNITLPTYNYLKLKLELTDELRIYINKLMLEILINLSMSYVSKVKEGRLPEKDLKDLYSPATNFLTSNGLFTLASFPLKSHFLASEEFSRIDTKKHVHGAQLHCNSEVQKMLAKLLLNFTYLFYLMEDKKPHIDLLTDPNYRYDPEWADLISSNLKNILLNSASKMKSFYDDDYNGYYTKGFADFDAVLGVLNGLLNDIGYIPEAKLRLLDVYYSLSIIKRGKRQLASHKSEQAVIDLLLSTKREDIKAACLKVLAEFTTKSKYIKLISQEKLTGWLARNTRYNISESPFSRLYHTLVDPDSCVIM